MPLINNIKYIFKKVSCGCIITANIHKSYPYALIQRVNDKDGCGFCTEEQKEETERHLWLTETEKYTWEDLLKCYGWKSDSDRKSDGDRKSDSDRKMNYKDENDDRKELPDITNFIEIMDRGDSVEHIWDRHCGERIDRTFNSKDID